MILLASSILFYLYIRGFALKEVENQLIPTVLNGGYNAINYDIKKAGKNTFAVQSWNKLQKIIQLLQLAFAGVTKKNNEDQLTNNIESLRASLEDFSETLWKISIAAKKQKNSFMSQSGVPDAIYKNVWEPVTKFLVTNATTQSIMSKMTITDGKPAKVQLTK